MVSGYYLLYFVLLLCLALKNSDSIPIVIVRAETNDNIPVYEYNALYDLYNATNGPGWLWTESLGSQWVFAANANPCVDNWQGILCYSVNSAQRIFEIALSGMNLEGTLPTSIGDIDQLQVLILSSNALNGDIPVTLANCTELYYIGLQGNQFNTTFPEVFGQLPKLQTLNLDNNAFHGSIPDTFTLTPTMVEVAMSHNSLTGCPPQAAGDASNLLYLYLDDNLFHCTVPGSYGNFTNLEILRLDDNYLYGTIPASLNGLSALQTIDVSGNRLTGSLLDATGMVHLVQYFLASNYLTGELPIGLAEMVNLAYFDVSGNFISGSLPHDIGQLSLLLTFYGYYNMLTGTIPASFANCTPMYYFVLNNNLLTGTVPASLGQLTRITYFHLENNHLSGTLPTALSGMTRMYLFDCAENHLTGTIPPEYSMWTGAVYFVTTDNHLSGTIPGVVFAGMSEMYQFDLAGGQFTGTIPSVFGSLLGLQYFNVFDNQLTGSMPPSFGDLARLQFMFTYQNRLTGTIPDSYGGMTYLEQAGWDFNLLSGTLPESVGALPFLQFLFVDVNMLTGSFPRSFATAVYLIALDVNHNHLTGTLDGVFNASNNVELLTLVLSDNQLSGTLPAELFRLPKLNSLSAVSNCIQGQVPLEVCDSSLLVTLALDGLSSASSCRDTLLSGLSKTYIIRDSRVGTIPPCLFRMPILTTLHLSGNGLTGSIPDVPSESYLLDLSLSHNELTGAIPPNMQQRLWFNLDLAYNRLTDSLVPQFQSQMLNASYFEHLGLLLSGLNISQANAYSTLAIENNRVSGAIPQCLLQRHNVSILGSNVFSCDIAETNLPHYDSGRGNYQCGSDSFNLPFYLWLALLCVSLAAAWLVHRYQEVIQRYVGIEYALNHVYKWYYVLEDHPDLLGGARLSAYRRVLQLGEALCLLGLRCTGYMLLVLMPIYAACSHYRGTILHQYAWTLSAAYLTGWIPAMLMLVFLVVLVAYAAQTMLSVRYQQLAAVHDASSRTAPAAVTRVDSSAVVGIIYALFLIVNLLVVVGVNTAYVLAAIYGERRVLFPAQLGLSLFKLLWNRFFSVYLIRWTARLKALVGVPATEAESEGGDQQQSAESQFVSLQMFVALLNNIAVPCLVVMVVSPSCLYNVFVAAPEVEAVYTYESCGYVFGAECLYFVPGFISTSYNPPFTYSYQCSSSFITYYAPTFVLLCLLRAFVSPLQQFLVYHLHRRSTPGTRWNALLDSLLLPNLKSIVPGQAARRDVFKPFFDANQLLLSLVTYLGILLTFGAVFPPVALAILVTLLAVFHFNKLKVNRFIRRAVEQQQLDYMDVVEAESARAGFLPVLQRAAWMLVTVSCWFYTLFLFDTLGDAVGFGGAYWVLIVMPLMPLGLYVLHKCLLFVRQQRDKHSSRGLADQSVKNVGDQDQEVGMVEMRPKGEMESTTINVLQQVPA
jgi:Leucine-rich repeat (LRR) protein